MLSLDLFICVAAAKLRKPWICFARAGPLWKFSYFRCAAPFVARQLSSLLPSRVLPCDFPLYSPNPALMPRIRRGSCNSASSRAAPTAPCGLGMMCASPSGRVSRSAHHSRVARSHATLALASLSFSLSERASTRAGESESGATHVGPLATANRMRSRLVKFPDPNPCPIAVHMEPFSTSVFIGLI